MKNKFFVLILSVFTFFSLTAAGLSPVQKAYYQGSDSLLFEELVKSISDNPESYRSFLYFRDVLLMDFMRDAGWYVSFAEKYITSLQKSNAAEKSNLILQASLLLDEFKYRHLLADAYSGVNSGHFISRWKIHDPYLRYGHYDFREEDILRLSAKEKFRNIGETDNTGRIYLSSYIHEDSGVIRSDTTIHTPGPVKLRINSNTEYKVFINGKLVLENLYTAKKRNLRILGTASSGILTLSLVMQNRKDGYFSIMTTNSQDIPVSCSPVNSPVTAGLDVSEVYDFPLNTKAEATPEGLFLRAWTLSCYESTECFDYYEKSLNLGYNPVVELHYASDLLVIPASVKWPRTEGWKRIEHIRKKHPDFLPVRYYSCWQKMNSGSLAEASAELLDLLNSDYYYGKTLYLRLLDKSQRDSEFLRQLSLMQKAYPHGKAHLQQAALFYENRDSSRYLDLLKDYTSNLRSEALSYDLMKAYISQGKSDLAYTAGKEYVQQKRYCFSSEYYHHLIHSGKYEDASTSLLSYSVFNNSPYIQYLLGLNKAYQGQDPDMYWSAIEGGEISFYFPQDYLSYINNSDIALFSQDDISAIEDILQAYTKGEPVTTHFPFRSHNYRVYSSGSAHFQSEELIYMKDEQDIRALGEYAIPYAQPRLLTARVYKRDGSYTVSTGLQSVRGRTYLTLDNLSIDSLVHITYEALSTSSIPQTAFYITEPVFMNEFDKDLGYFKVSVQAPEDIQLQLASNTTAAVKRKLEQNSVTLSLQIENLPQIRREDYSGSAEFTLPWYQICTSSDESLYFKHLQGQTSLTTVSKGNNPESLQSLYRKLQEEIRDDSFISMTPLHPDDTLYYKRGSEADKVYLCQSLLAQQGIASYPCIVQNPEKNSKRMLTPGSFYGMVLYIPSENVYLDFSSRYIQAGTLSPEYAMETGYVLYPSSTEKRKLHSLNEDIEKMEMTIDCTKPGGKFEAQLGYGGYPSSIRSYFRDSRYLDTYLSQLLNNFSVNLLYTDAAYSDPLLIEQDFTISLSGLAPSYFSQSGSLISIAPFIRKSAVLSYTTETNRSQNIFIKQPINTRDEYTIILPDAFIKSSMKENISVSFDNASASFTLLKKPGVNILVATETIHIPKSVITAEDYPRFHVFAQKIHQWERKTITLQEVQ